MLLQGLGGMGKRTFEILACLSLDGLLVVVIFFVSVLLNCKSTYCLKDLLSLLAINLFHPDL